MSKSCGCNKPCTCANDTLGQTQGCSNGYPECNTPEECSETFKESCVVWTWDSIVGSLGNVQIPQGGKMSAIIQRIIGMLQNSGCNYPGTPCQSVVGFHSENITQTTATFVWLAGKEGTSYHIEYKTIGAENWTVNSSTSALTGSIAGLTSNTEYMVRVISVCGANSCNSLIIKIKTKS